MPLVEATLAVGAAKPHCAELVAVGGVGKAVTVKAKVFEPNEHPVVALVPVAVMLEVPAVAGE